MCRRRGEEGEGRSGRKGEEDSGRRKGEEGEKVRRPGRSRKWVRRQEFSTWHDEYAGTDRLPQTGAVFFSFYLVVLTSHLGCSSRLT